MTQRNPLFDALAEINTVLAGEKIKLKRSVATIRIIGEFSSGKTRLMTELFGEYLPEALLPISSRECQTMLPLEITYGEEPALDLIKRVCDEASSTVLQPLKSFPERDALTKFDKPLDPKQHRLRLMVPEPKLCIQKDGIEEGEIPKRITLIDMPGWNNDDFDAERDKDKVVDKWTFGLIYVLAATRIDSQHNQKELMALLEVLQDEAYFVSVPTLLVVITHCEDHFKEKAIELMGRRLESIKTELGYKDLKVKIQCVDFGTLSPEEKNNFKQQFWDNLFAGWKDYAAFDKQKREIEVGRYIGTWKPQKDFEHIRQVVLEAERIVSNFINKTGAFIPTMNYNRLVSLRSSSECREKLWHEWQKTLGTVDLTQPFFKKIEPLVMEKNPFCPWWNTFFVAPIREALKRVDTLLNDADYAFEQVYRVVKEAEADSTSNSNSNQKFNLNEYLSHALKAKHQETRLFFEKQTQLLLDPKLALNAAIRSATPEQALATLMVMTSVSEVFEGLHTTRSF